MKSFLLCTALCLAAVPAMALEITNLDKVDHRVMFEAGGSKQIYDVKVDQKIYITGQSNGRLSLLSVPVKKGRDVVQSDGILSDYIGNGRTVDISVDQDDEFVIWEGGQMGIQSRKRHSRYGG